MTQLNGKDAGRPRGLSDDVGGGPQALSASVEEWQPLRLRQRIVAPGDGDSLCVGRTGNPGEWIEVRLADFYAPELSSPGGPQAKAVLQQLVMGRALACEADHRSYDRIVAWCTLNGASVGDLMRRRGVAEGGNGR